MKLSNLKDLQTKALAAALNVKGREVLVERLAELGLPGKKSEAYRYFDAESLFAKEYKHSLTFPKPSKRERRSSLWTVWSPLLPKDFVSTMKPVNR